MLRKMRKVLIVLMCMVMVMLCGGAVSADEITAAEEAAIGLFCQTPSYHREKAVRSDLLMDFYLPKSDAEMDTLLREQILEKGIDAVPYESIVDLAEPNVGKVVVIRHNQKQHIYLMQQDAAGAWQKVKEADANRLMLARRSYYDCYQTLPTAYMPTDMINGYLFVPGSDAVYVANFGKRGMDEVLENWYGYWVENIEEEAYETKFYGYYEQQDEEAFTFADGAMIAGILLLLLLFIFGIVRLFRKVKNEDNSFIEKTPLMWRLISGVTTRYPGRWN